MDTHQIAAWLAAHPLEALMALGVVLNLVNGLLPSRVRSGPVGRAVHVLLDRVSVLTRADAPGTLKWPLVVGSILRAGADAIDPPKPAPRDGERGHARTGVLVTVLAVALLPVALIGCPPRPTPEPGPSQPVSGWTSTARAVLSTLRWALPAARAVTDSLLSDPPRTQVARALDAAADAAGRLDVALSAYESRGGDRCVAHAAAGGVVVALEQLADVLADQGIALGVVLGRVVDGAASIVDALVPACAADAGWTSAGDLANGRLRLVEDVARRRGIALRRDLDEIAEPSR